MPHVDAERRRAPHGRADPGGSVREVDAHHLQHAGWKRNGAAARAEKQKAFAGLTAILCHLFRQDSRHHVG